jgi:putative tryptophan/tyrosine transport system substrate-binding protein
MNNRRKLVIALGAGAFTMPLVSPAQQQGKVWRVGFLAQRSRPASLDTDVYGAFPRGMRNLGYVEGKNLVIEWRFADGKIERLAGLAAELVRLKVDVIVAGATPSVQAAHQATNTIPIVLVAVPDPVGEGFVKSLSRPGGNITGLSSIVTEVSIKHLELLRTLVPKLSRVAVLINPLNPSDSLILEQINGVAYTTGVKVILVEANTASQIEACFGAMTRAHTGALIVAADELFYGQREQIAKLAVKNRLPTMSPNREMTQAGGLMSYGQDLVEHYLRAATYVDKILKGAKPGDLPVEQPTIFELVVNMKTAKALGLKIPNSILVQATKVIE